MRGNWLQTHAQTARLTTMRFGLLWQLFCACSTRCAQRSNARLFREHRKYLFGG